MQKLCFCFCTLTSSRLAQSCLKLPAINWKLAKQLWFSEAGQREQRLDANLYAKQRFSHNKMWKPQFQTLTEDKLHLLNSVLVVCEDRAELPSLLTDDWWRQCIFRRLRLLIWLLCPPPDCRFTCHYRCRALIRVDCIWDGGSVTDHTCAVEHTVETDTNVVSVPWICPPSQGGSWWNTIMKRSKRRENQEKCKMLHTNASRTCWGSKGGT